jgi:hypothetical protein
VFCFDIPDIWGFDLDGCSPLCYPSHLPIFLTFERGPSSLWLLAGDADTDR